jgi:Peptidase family M28
VLAPIACRSAQGTAPPTDGPEALRAHPAALERAAAYVARELRAAGGRVGQQVFEVEGETYRNVRAFFGPTRGARPVVGAHYDVAGEGPGVDDNASGVAVLPALAHGLAEEDLELPVELVAYSLEEPPHFGSQDMGSVRHARLLADEGVELRGMISLEMLGYYRDEPGSQRYPAPVSTERYPDVGDFLAVVARPRDAALAGTIQAAMVTDTAFFRNPNYHEPTDTPDTLDYRRMARATAGVLAAVLALDAEP